LHAGDGGDDGGARLSIRAVQRQRDGHRVVVGNGDATHEASGDDVHNTDTNTRGGADSRRFSVTTVNIGVGSRIIGGGGVVGGSGDGA
jgi:hypothetical protein